MAEPHPILAAGALVYRWKHGRLQVRLVHRPRHEGGHGVDWSWPKGKQEDGETLAATAAREVHEETGHPVVLGVPLGTIEYPVGARLKRVSYWAARKARAGVDDHALSVRAPVTAASDGEVDRGAWVSLAEARARLTYPQDVLPLDALEERLTHDTWDTHALVVVRHGHALPRARWSRPDPQRPLTPLGHGNAYALMPLLSAYGVESIVTSWWTRCADTIRPYATAAHITWMGSDYLGESAHRRSPDRVVQTVNELMDTPESAVLCTHRPVLPTVFETLGRRVDAGVKDDLLPHSDPFLEPGEALIVHITPGPRGSLVTAVEKVAPKVW